MMTESRERILNKIKSNIGRENNLTETEISILEDRLKGSEPNLIPKRGVIKKDALLKTFINRAKEVASSIAVIDSLSEIPAEVIDYLAKNNIASKIVVLPNEDIDFIDWHEHPTLEVVNKYADEKDETVLVSSFSAIAETGTVVQLSGPQNPITSHFLPDNSIVLIKASRIKASSEDAFKLIRKELKNIPRTVSLISGPSRTGDIALKIEMGAHGPRKVHLIIWNDMEQIQ